MPGGSPEEVAADLARSAAGLPATAPATVLPVRRTDRPDRDYWLVVLGPSDRPVGVAAVDRHRREVLSSARLTGARAHLAVDAAEAVRRAGRGAGAAAELVWAPSAASRSPLYPVWEVRDGPPVYVDLAGRVWPGLGTARG